MAALSSATTTQKKHELGKNEIYTRQTIAAFIIAACFMIMAVGKIYFIVYEKRATVSRTFRLLTHFRLATTSTHTVRPLLPPDSPYVVCRGRLLLRTLSFSVRSCKGHCVSATAGQSFYRPRTVGLFPTHHPFDDNDHH